MPYISATRMLLEGTRCFCQFKKNCIIRRKKIQEEIEKYKVILAGKKIVLIYP